MNCCLICISYLQRAGRLGGVTVAWLPFEQQIYNDPLAPLADALANVL